MAIVAGDGWELPLTGPEAVPCQHCGAAAGAPCRRTNGDASKRIHAARRNELAFQRWLAARRPRIAWARRAEGRRLLREADGKPCPLCSQPIVALSALAHIDHIVPFGIGGKDRLDNLRVVHRSCNLGRRRTGVPT